MIDVPAYSMARKACARFGSSGLKSCAAVGAGVATTSASHRIVSPSCPASFTCQRPPACGEIVSTAAPNRTLPAGSFAAMAATRLDNPRAE